MRNYAYAPAFKSWTKAHLHGRRADIVKDGVSEVAGRVLGLGEREGAGPQRLAHGGLRIDDLPQDLPVTRRTVRAIMRHHSEHLTLIQRRRANVKRGDSAEEDLVVAERTEHCLSHGSATLLQAERPIEAHT